MEYVERDYARVAIQRLARARRTLLYADVGMGKTAMVLTAALLRHNLEAPVFPMLIVSFNRLVHTTWPDEIAKWDHTQHLRYVEITGNANQRLACLHKDAEVYGIAFHNMPWLIRQPGVKEYFRSLIVDECTRLATNRARFTKPGTCIFGGGKQASSIAWLHAMLQGKRKEEGGWFVALSGSGVGDSLHKAWGVSWFCDFGTSLGFNYTRFEHEFFYRAGFKIIPRADAAELIAERMKPYTITLRAADYMPLEEPNYVDVPVRLPIRHMVKYAQLKREAKLMIEDAEPKIVNATAVALSEKLSQFASGFVLPGYNEITDTEDPPQSIHNEKTNVLRDLIEEIGRPVIVVYYYQESKKRLADAFEIRFAEAGDSGVLHDWNAGKVPILGLHWQAAHGLNLQHGGHDIIFYEARWSYEYYYQAINRIGPARQLMSGFNRVVNVYQLRVCETIEDELTHALKSKQTTHERLINFLLKE